MPTIRDLVAALRQRDGVEAAVVLGRDGLLIDSQTEPTVDAGVGTPPSDAGTSNGGGSPPPESDSGPNGSGHN